MLLDLQYDFTIIPFKLSFLTNINLDLDYVDNLCCEDEQVIDELFH